jgi:hypothetical protein
VCAPESLVPGISYGDTAFGNPSKEIPPRGEKEWYTGCKQPGHRLIGGGFEFEMFLAEKRYGNGFTNLIRSHPVNNARDWAVAAINNQSKSQPIPMRDEVLTPVVCVPEGVVRDLNVQSANRSGSGTNKDMFVATPDCRAGTHLLGGGAGVPGPDGEKALWRSMRFGDGGGPNTHWFARADTSARSITVWSYAVCGVLGGSPQPGTGPEEGGKRGGANPGWATVPGAAGGRVRPPRRRRRR